MSSTDTRKPYPTPEEVLRKGVVTTTEATHALEEKVRKKATHGAVPLFFVNGYSAILVFIFHLISLETMFSIFLSVGFTLLVYYERKDVSAK